MALASLLPALVLGAVLASTAFAALPRTYTVQRVDSPSPLTNGRFAMSMANVGDPNGDGKDDFITGTDKHGSVLGQGQVSVISGANGSTLRQYLLPDLDTGGPGDRTSGFGAAVAKFGDIGSCTGAAPAAGAVCPASPIGPPDGIPEHVVSATGVDVAADGSTANQALNNNLGVVYVFDGRTGALLKRLEMPTDDRALQTGGFASPQDPHFGRTLLWPSGRTPCAGSAGIGACPPVSSAVNNGDLDGDGKPDLLVGAGTFSDTPASAHPASPCAPPNTINCESSGRVYIYYGKDIAGDPATPLQDPALITKIKNPLAQPDSPNPPTIFANGEGFGFLLVGIGDAGACNDAVVANPAARCANATSPNAPDGVPDFAIAAHGVDLFGFYDVGQTTELDGRKLANIKSSPYPDSPRSSLFWGLAQNGVVSPPLGDVVGSARPDYYIPEVQYGGEFAAQGRGLIVNGDPVSTRPFFEFPSRLVDPTPQTAEQFGSTAAGVGNVAGAETDPALDDSHGEMLVGAIGPHNPATNPKVINDVHFFSPITGTALQSIPAPDQQGGEGFGISAAPLGDLNGDGFLDFAVGAGFHRLSTSSGTCAAGCANAGRAYIFTSDNSPGPPAPGPVVGPPGVAGTPGAPGTPAQGSRPAALAGRAVELVASRTRVRPRRSLTLKGTLDAFANKASCERGQAVSLQKRARGNSRYRTFATVKTDRRGDFAKRGIRPSISTVYRARVSQTSQCLGAVSNRELVTVTRSMRNRR